jgi:formylglycine-generating enzyme required for sulfatase activity
LWYTVKTWAESNGSTFYNTPGGEGSTGTTGAAPTEAKKQVTTVTWFDAVVWCNALTEWYNTSAGTSLTAVYYYSSAYASVAKDSDPTSNFVKESGGDNYASAYAKPGTTGFRLPSSNEWELAARWRNDTINVVSASGSGPWFTKGDSASGATASYSDATATGFVGVYLNNASKTAAVKSKTANALGLYDISGNVWEWCYDWYPGYIGSLRFRRGGSYGNNAAGMQTGYVANSSPDGRALNLGLRPARVAE